MDCLRLRHAADPGAPLAIYTLLLLGPPDCMLLQKDIIAYLSLCKCAFISTRLTYTY